MKEEKEKKPSIAETLRVVTFCSGGMTQWLSVDP